MLSCCRGKTLSWEGRFIWFARPMSQSLRTIRAGTEAEITSNAYWPMFRYISYTAQVHLPRDSPANSELGPIDSQENALQTFPQVNPMGAILHLRVSLFLGMSSRPGKPTTTVWFYKGLALNQNAPWRPTTELPCARKRKRWGGGT